MSSVGHSLLVSDENDAYTHTELDHFYKEWIFFFIRKNHGVKSSQKSHLDPI